MNTTQLFFRARNARNDEEVLEKVQGYLAALLHNGQIVGDHIEPTRTATTTNHATAILSGVPDQKWTES